MKCLRPVKIKKLFSLIKGEIIYKSDLFQQEVTLTVDENLNKLKGKIHDPGKLAAANKSLKKLKNSLPK
jgi:hypothetical protein